MANFFFVENCQKIIHLCLSVPNSILVNMCIFQSTEIASLIISIHTILQYKRNTRVHLSLKRLSNR